MYTMVFGGKNTIDNFVVNGIKDLLAGKSLQAKPKVDALVNLPKNKNNKFKKKLIN